MANSNKEQLPMGRVALAQAFCAEWISEHGKSILYSFLTLIVVSFTLFQVTSKFSGRKKSDYLEIQRAFTAWISQEAQDHALLKNLEKPLGRHPELQAKFGTQIAQRLLGLGEASKANSYAKAAMGRARDLTSSYYSRFSKNTLMISEGKYQEALAEAKQMKADLEKDDPFWDRQDKMVRSGSVLYAYNLVRIATLEGQLGSKEGELKAWDELVQNAGWKGIPPQSKTYDPEAYSLLAQNFKQGDISFLDFIEKRKKELTHLLK